MLSRIALVTIVLVLALSMAACGSSGQAPKDRTATPPADVPADAPVDDSAGDAAGGTRLAAGLYDIEGGKVQAIGILQYRDVEGGFYAITFSDDADSEVLAVVANEQEFRRQLEPLKGSLVDAIGTRSDGVSTRMAGPEIVIESITKADDAAGAAE